MPHSLSTPLIAGIAPGIPGSMTVPAQLNVQVLPNSLQQESGTQQNQEEHTDSAETQAEAGTASSVNDAEPESNDGNENSSNDGTNVSRPAAHSDTLMTSPQREPKRPVPIPRNYKRISIIDGGQGATSGGEMERGRSQSVTGSSIEGNEGDLTHTGMYFI